jgi:hypothetical protein
VPELLLPDKIGVVDLASGMVDRDDIAVKIEGAYFQKYGMGGSKVEMDPENYSESDEAVQSTESDVSGSSDESDDMMDGSGAGRDYEAYLSPLGARRADGAALLGIQRPSATKK